MSVNHVAFTLHEAPEPGGVFLQASFIPPLSSAPGPLQELALEIFQIAAEKCEAHNQTLKGVTP